MAFTPCELAAVLVPASLIPLRRRENGFAAAAGFQSFVDASRSQSMMDPDVLAGRARIRYGELPGTDGRFGFIKEEYLGTEKYGQGIPLHTR